LSAIFVVKARVKGGALELVRSDGIDVSGVGSPEELALLFAAVARAEVKNDRVVIGSREVDKEGNEFVRGRRRRRRTLNLVRVGTLRNRFLRNYVSSALIELGAVCVELGSCRPLLDLCSELMKRVEVVA